MSDIPRLRLLISHSEDFSGLDGEDARAVEVGLRKATYEVVAPTLLAGWAANEVPLLRVAGSPVSYIELLPCTDAWTAANRFEYMRQQAQLINHDYNVAAATVNLCEMCTATKHCDSTCKNIILPTGAPVTVSVNYDGHLYTAQLLFSFEWESDPPNGHAGGSGA